MNWVKCRAGGAGVTNDTQQELAFLYDPHRCSIRHVPMTAPDFPRFDGTYAIDLDVDAVTDPIRFSKPPFEAVLVCHDGRRITLIGAHLKSDAVFINTDYFANVDLTRAGLD